ncbi:hypothetical protein [Falsiruegeria mediterranea]|uniref:hypothetical protein n=1 Tax=Falsiruegeria mediterranea TaxID=1280832 RepID=UPI0015F27713|nr:hypothetical protein [Falsiruegeria mediterranea]
MEQDLGIDKLSPNERDILLAFHANAWETSDKQTVCSTELVREHPTVQRISQPTFHRTLRKLLDKGFITPARDVAFGVYALPQEKKDN